MTNIQEAFTPEAPHSVFSVKHTTSELFSALKQHSVSSSQKRLGAGAFGFAREPKEKASDVNDHEIVKVCKTQKGGHESDPYVSYIKQGSRSPENPHFPKVHSIKSYNCSDGGSVHVVKMEKLRELHDLSSDELRVAVKHASNKNPQSVYSPVHAANKVDGGGNNHSPHMREALHAIRSMSRDRPGWKPDLHSGNIMARRTHLGHQLVITDPLYE